MRSGERAGESRNSLLTHALSNSRATRPLNIAKTLCYILPGPFLPKQRPRKRETHRGERALSGIQGLGGVSGPKPDRPDDKPAHKPVNGDEKAQTGDGVVISSEAQAAARVASLTLRAQGESDIRADKVQAAKEAIERGDYKNPDIVSETAAKINKIL